MKSIYLLIAAFCICTCSSYGQTPVSHPGAIWDINETFTDEFNSGQLDQTKWDHNPSDWGTWSWEPENAYIKDTVLALQMVQKTHVRNSQDFYFTSGITRHRETFTYGYFESRIKGSEKGQGTCPAFWNYSRGNPTPTEEGGVKYCEIDAVEIFQIPYDFERLEMNLHARIIENGELTWIRPGQGHAELTHNTWLAPWDPRDDFHTYGVWARVDSIFWYVDGIQRGSKKNHYWHLPMYPTISMGLRTPYEKYINGVRTVIPYPDSIPEPGFPTEMYCDYVRVWNTKPQLYVDREKYYDASFSIQNNLEVDCRYFAGNGQSVLSEGWNGMTCKLQEVQSDGTVVNEIEKVDPTIVGEESGVTKFVFSLDGLMPSATLPTGNKYIIKPVFRTSENGGNDIYLDEEYYSIHLSLSSSINDTDAKEKISIVYNSNGISIQLDEIINEANITIHDFAGRQLYNESSSESEVLVSSNIFPVSGIYLVSVKAGALYRVEKISIFHN